MYAWIWRHLPGPRWLRALQLVVAFLLIVAVLFVWVFPWAETWLPFTDVTVEESSSG